MIPAGGCRYPKNDKSKQVVKKEHGNFRSDEDLYMDGMEIMNFSLREVPKIVDSVLALRGWNKDEVGFFGFHQANKFMLEYLRKKIKLPEEKVPIAMSETGNTGPTSIPLLLSQEYGALSQQKRLNKAVLCGFGVGLSCGAVALDLSQTKIYDPIEL
jgi:3-oxoacyl-[acyl-carrier-protein] synthase-3